MLRGAGPLSGKRVLVTSGPTSEPIDPVRYPRQSLVGQAGPRHRRGGGRRRRAGGADQRSGQFARSAGRRRGSHRDRAANARGGRESAAGGHRGVRRRGRRLARRNRRARAKSRSMAGRRPSDWPRIPTSSRPSLIASPDGRTWSSASPPKPTTSLPMPRRSLRGKAVTGSSPTMYRPRPASWAATATRSIRDRGRRRILAAAIQGRRSRALVARIAEAFKDAKR